MNLEIKDLFVEVDKLSILKGVNLKIKSGEIHVIMGQNGSGKSTLLKSIMGHPKYTIKKGSIKIDNKEIKNLETDKRAKLGLFLGFQNPTEVAGVSLGSFLRLAKNSGNKEKAGPLEFSKSLKEKAQLLKLDEKFINRGVNEDASGGEKKKSEIVQMAILEPKFILLDEIDSGLDIDALKTVANAIKQIFKKTKPGILLITHYKRILKYIEPDHVHVMANGKIVKSGTKALAHKLEKEGYKSIVN